ncbi:MAG: hypothetical protein AAGC57_18995 [Pseudomonadota bacterium]
MDFDYKTVAGPERAKKRKGCRTPSERVAGAMEDLIRAEAAEGWEYLRTDLVPVEERAGLFSRRQSIHCAVLIFRRPRGSTSDRAALSRKAQAIFGGDPGNRRTAMAEPRLGSAPTLAAPTGAIASTPMSSETVVAAAPTPEQLQAAVLAAKPYPMTDDGDAKGPGNVPPAPPSGAGGQHPFPRRPGSGR